MMKLCQYATSYASHRLLISDRIRMSLIDILSLTRLTEHTACHGRETFSHTGQLADDAPTHQLHRWHVMPVNVAHSPGSHSF